MLFMPTLLLYRSHALHVHCTHTRRRNSRAQAECTQPLALRRCERDEVTAEQVAAASVAYSY